MADVAGQIAQIYANYDTMIGMLRKMQADLQAMNAKPLASEKAMTLFKSRPLSISGMGDVCRALEALDERVTRIEAQVARTGERIGRLEERLDRAGFP
jgi:hypothetical protein